MVQFISLPESTRSRESRDAATSAGNALGQYFGYGARKANIEGELGGIRQALSQPGVKPEDVLTQFAKASAILGPGADRFLSALAPMYMKRAEAEANVRARSGEGDQQQTTQRDNTRLQVPQRQQMPGFMQNGVGPQKGMTAQEFTEAGVPKTYPRQQPLEEGPGSLPQQGTTGVVEPLMSPREMKALAKSRAEADIREGSPNPRTQLEHLKDVEFENDITRKHNANVNDENKKLAEAQKNAGDEGSLALKRYFKPEEIGTDEENKFREKNEFLQSQGKSEAERKTILDLDAKNLKDAIVNAKEHLTAPRSYNKIQRQLDGDYKDFETAKKDIRSLVKPIINMGLTDKARTIISNNLGFYPEETEMILQDLSPSVKNIISNYVPINPPGLTQKGSFGYSPKDEQENYNRILSTLGYALKSDPDANLMLMRKAMEPKPGHSPVYDPTANEFYRLYNQAINELIQNGGQDENGWKPNAEQQKQLKYTQKPPLSFLGKILHGLGLQGR
jgi:hypothetical protein